MRPTIDLNNKYRVLLTEVLPYELPLMMNNEAFYQNMKDESLRRMFLDIFRGMAKRNGWTIPFDYCIRRVGGEKSRKLSLMHPLTQLDCVDLYARYDDYMLNLCSHSPFSIRYIDKKAKCVFPQEEVDVNDTPADEMERHVELVDEMIETRYRSYFSYKKYDLAYKFFDSGDNLRLEQKYPYMMTIDIAGCFYHIYTHSIAWAVKGKAVAKENIGRDTFENNFDTLMQHANYNETNGIIVGPEISRIFAEIILQSIDLAVMRQLKDKYDYSLGRDYEIRRYVDDSYVYANSRKTLENVCSAFQDYLAFYKMDINKSKLEIYERPFTTGIDDAKRAINRMVADFKERFLVAGEDKQYEKTVRSDMAVFSSFIKQFRSITHQFQQNYGALNKYTLTLLLRQIRAEIRKGMIPSLGLMAAYTEIAFYIYSLDMHTTASYRLCSILDCLVQWSSLNSDVLVKQELMNRMRREAKRVLDIYQTNLSDVNTNLEAQNLLITLNRLIGLKLSVKQIEALFGVDVDAKRNFGNLNYFQICTILYVIDNFDGYEELKNCIEENLLLRFEDPMALQKSELAYLFFDMITCPFISRQTKLSLIEKATGCPRDKAGNKRVQLSNPGRWFFDWDKNHSLTSFLNKKEYHSPYE